MSTDLDYQYVRNQFPCLDKQVERLPVIYLDGPGGSQVPRRVAEKMLDYLYYHNANAHGCFQSSLESDQMLLDARKTVADFLGSDPDEIAFGESSTTNLFKLAVGLARDFKPGDEIIITDIDHEGNRAPWLFLRDYGLLVKSVRVDKDTCTVDLEDYQAKLSEKTKLVAMNWASNAVGTISDVKTMIDMAHQAGAMTVVDAVHYAAHLPMDVKAIDTDFLVCSAYKFFGPHLGVIYGKKEIMQNINTIRVEADDNTEPPEKFETGTPNFEAACGAAEAVKFIADLGKVHESLFNKTEATNEQNGSEQRRHIINAMTLIHDYEQNLSEKLVEKISAHKRIKLYGPPPGSKKTSTIGFTVEGKSSLDVARHLAGQGIYVWDGDFYAIELVNQVLSLKEQGGLVRIGLAPYNTMEEMEKTAEAILAFCDR